MRSSARSGRTSAPPGASIAGATLTSRRAEYDLDGKVKAGDPAAYEVLHSVHVMTDNPDALPVPLSPRPAFPVSV